jgi:hypothetical protein
VSLTFLRPAASRAGSTSIALGRAGAGASMLVRPRTLPTMLGLDSASTARITWVVQLLGARDLALGLGAAQALRYDARAGRTWLAAGMPCDAVDALVLAAAAGRGRVSRPAAAVVVVAAAAAAAVQARDLRS